MKEPETAIDKNETKEPEAPVNSKRRTTTRDTKSYMTLYTGLQSRVDTALLLLSNVNCDKASTQLMDAVKNLLKGNQ